MLNRLLDGDFSEGISNGQYSKVAKVSPATATRHLAQLVELGCLVKTEAGGQEYAVSAGSVLGSAKNNWLPKW